MNYKVHFVDDETFNGLPGRSMDTKLGVAYPESGEAYVRKTGSNVVDVFTLAHELEHLQGDDLDEHYDAENKAFYKDFGQTLQAVAPVASFIPGIGGLVSAGAGIGGKLMSNNYQAKQAKSSMNQLTGQQPGGAFDQFQNGNQPNIIQAPGNNFGAAGGSGNSTGGLGGLRQELFGSYMGR